MRFITLLSIALWSVLVAGAVLANAQRTTIVNLASVPKWQVEKSRNVSLSDVRNWGVLPAVDHEYGVKKIEIRTYRQGKRTVQALVEKTADPSSAFGLLTFYQNESMKPEKGMKLTVTGPDQALMARGPYFVRVQRPVKPKMSDSDFRSMLIDIAGAEPSSETMSLLPPPLPTGNRVPGSEKYVLGPVAAKQALPSFPVNLVGFQQGAELEAATYHSNGHRATLVLLSYPTPQIAHLHYAALVHTAGLNQKSGSGALYGKMKGTYILVVQDAQSKAIANSLMSRLTIKEQLSWNQPPPGKPVTVQMLHLILGNILLVIILAVMAVCAGVVLVF